MCQTDPHVARPDPTPRGHLAAAALQTPVGPGRSLDLYTLVAHFLASTVNHLLGMRS